MWGGHVEDRAVAVGEMFDILAVFVEVQGGEFGRAACDCRAVALGAADQCGRDPVGHGHRDFAGRAA